MQKAVTAALFVFVLALLALTGCGLAPSGGSTAPPPTTPPVEPDRCPFRQTGERLRRQEPLTIVAIGSSSTVGAGASGPGTTYPAQLQAQLARELPGVQVVVHNKGVNGETAAQTLARFEADVLQLRPDMVIWQVGTNDALRHIPFATFAPVLEAGIELLGRHKIDLALLDPQYLGGGSETELARYQRQIQALAEQRGVPLIPRYHLMKEQVESGQFALTDLITGDGLHTTDIPYLVTAAYTARLITVDCAPPKRNF